MSSDLPSPVLQGIQMLLPWFFVLVDVAAIVLLLDHLQRSRWMIYILLAFGLDAVLLVADRILTPRMFSLPDHGGIQTYFALTGLLHLLQRALLVVGLAGLLSDRAQPTRAS